MGGSYFEYSIKSFEWERSVNNVKDFMTLVRQVVNIILGFQGIVAREFISNDGLLIITVCFSHEYNTKMVTEYLRMKKFLDIGFIDLMSMEPLDSKRRPLRLNKYLNDRDKWEERYPKHLQLYEEINDLLEDIDYLRIIRDFKGVWDKDMVRRKNCHMQIYEHSVESTDVWREYLKYLQNLNERVQDIRKTFIIKKKKLFMKHQAKFEGFTDMGFLLKNLLMKTTIDDIDILKNIKFNLMTRKQGKDIGCSDNTQLICLIEEI